MLKDHHERATSIRARTLMTILALTAVAALGSAAPALATPKGIFSVFAQCPTNEPGVSLCQYGQTTSGEFAIGKTKVPINKTITLQGGAIPTGGQNEYFLVPAKNGESLSKTELEVPGGLLDLINCKEIKGNGFWEIIERGSCELVFESGPTAVTATTELVANEHNPAILSIANLFFEEKTAITLPVRVHLKNTLLGESCYVGSEAHPIQLHLTTGTTNPPAPNKPIKGKRGELKVERELEETEEERSVTVLKENTLVDNAFPVPVAEGCGGFFSFLIDPIVDAKLGLESKAGNNTAILTGTLKTANAEQVIASEK